MFEDENVSKKNLIVKIAPLPPRDATIRANKPDDTKKQFLGKEGDTCYRSCDCSFGLICENNVCTNEW